MNGFGLVISRSRRAVVDSGEYVGDLLNHFLTLPPDPVERPEERPLRGLDVGVVLEVGYIGDMAITTDNGKGSQLR